MLSDLVVQGPLTATLLLIPGAARSERACAGLRLRASTAFCESPIRVTLECTRGIVARAFNQEGEIAMDAKIIPYEGLVIACSFLRTTKGVL